MIILDVPLRGNLSQIGLPKVLIALNRLRITGTLTVAVHDITRRVFINKGDAIFASSNYADDRLGEMLLKAGMITVEQYDKSVEMLKRTKLRQGAILVKLGFLTPKDLFWGVKYQVQQIIYGMFQMEGADYEFTEGPIPEDEVITLNMSMGALIYEGVKTITNWTRIRNEMPSTDVVLQLSDDPLSLFQGVELSPQDKKILSLVDGKRTIKQVMEDSWLNSFEALKALYLLWSIGIIGEKVAEVSPFTLEELLEPVSREEEEFMTNVNAMYSQLGTISNRDILQIGPDADIDEVRKSYFRLAKEFHPDRFYRSSDTTLKDKLSTIFDAITDAYNATKGEIESGVTPVVEIVEEAPAAKQQEPAKAEAPSAEQVASAKNAQDKYKRGVNAIKKGDFASAISLLDEATRLNPEAPEYWNYLSLALSKVPGRFKDSEKAMLNSIDLEPSNSAYYSNLGLIYMMAKEWNKARAQFEKALMLDPDNAKAAKGLKQLGD